MNNNVISLEDWKREKVAEQEAKAQTQYLGDIYAFFGRAEWVYMSPDIKGLKIHDKALSKETLSEKING